MFVKEETFNKYLKLIAAGIIPTSAKDIRGLKLGDLNSLPLYGIEVVKFSKSLPKSSQISKPLKEEELDIYEKLGIDLSLETTISNFINIIKKLEIIKLQIDKKKVSENLNFCLHLKGCHIVKQDCIIDNNIKEFQLLLNFQNIIFENITNDILNLIRDIIFKRVKELYIDNLSNSDYSYFPLLSSLTGSTSYEIFNVTSPDFKEWFDDLLEDTKLYIEFQITIDGELNPLDISGTINLAEQLIALGKTTIVKS